MESNQKGSKLPVPIGKRIASNEGRQNPINRFGLLSYRTAPKNLDEQSKTDTKKISSIGKFPRSRIGCLSTSSRIRPYPMRIKDDESQEPDSSQTDIAGRLDFDTTEANISQICTPSKINIFEESSLVNTSLANTTLANTTLANSNITLAKHNITSLISFSSPANENVPAASTIPSRPAPQTPKLLFSPLTTGFSPLPLQQQNLNEIQFLNETNAQLILISPTPKKAPLNTLQIEQVKMLSPSPTKFLDKSQLTSPLKKQLGTKATSPFIKWEVISKEAELLQAQTKIEKLEGELRDANVNYEEAKIEFNKQIEYLNSEVLSNNENNSELENQIQMHKMNEEQAIQQLNVARTEFNEQQQNYTREIAELQKENSQLNMLLTDFKSEIESIKTTHRNELMAFEQQQQMLQTELIKMNEQKSILETQCQEIYAQAKNAEELSAELVGAKNEILSLKETLKSYEEGFKLSQILQNEINQLKGYKTENERLIIDFAKEKEEKEKLEKEIEKLEQEKKEKEEQERMEKEENFKVIHFKQNPLNEMYQQQTEELNRLRDENQRLKAQVEILESGNDADMTKQMEAQVKYAQENEKLKQDIEKAEKRQKQIMDAFKKTSKEFREVCYILTGYRVDVLKQKIYKFSHVYAESPNDFLMFELEENGTMKLLETDYSKRISDLVQTFLTQYDSFPSFLAALTMDLFRKQTHFIEPSLL